MIFLLQKHEDKQTKFEAEFKHQNIKVISLFLLVFQERNADNLINNKYRLYWVFGGNNDPVHSLASVACLLSTEKHICLWDQIKLRLFSINISFLWKTFEGLSCFHTFLLLPSWDIFILFWLFGQINFLFQLFWFIRLFTSTTWFM
jgi:hypothetical protein